VMDQKTLESFTKAGLSDSITVTLAIGSPIFIIEAVGTSPQQATGTVREVIKALDAQVKAQQASYGVMPQDTITTKTLTDGADVETVTSKVKRVLVVTAGLGLLLTAAGTIGIDVFLRWLRNRRRGGADDSVEQADDEPETAASPVIQPRFVATRGAATPGSSEETQVIGRIPSTRAASNGEVQLAKAAVPAAGRASTRGSGRSSVRIENGAGRRSGEADDNGTNNGRLPAVSSAEATIILPIPRSQWSRGSNDRNGGS
jgi:hypothetical protein